MDAVTYPNKAVADFVTENLTPVRIVRDRQLAQIFAIKWTPTLILLDFEGNEVIREVGFLTPDRLVPTLMLGLGKVKFYAEQYDEAVSSFERVAAEHPMSDQAPEAIYFIGVARFMSTQDMKPLKEAYQRLKDGYPESTWTTKAYPYAEIE